MPLVTRLAAEAGHALQAAGLQLTCAESCTGGGIAEAITRIAGSSAWFEAGYVTYSNRQKTAMLGVPASLLEQVGAVSREVVQAMAQGALAASGADIAVAVSGVAGPGGGTPQLPVGTVWLAWADARGGDARCYRFEGDRDSIRREAVIQGLHGVIDRLQHR